MDWKFLFAVSAYLLRSLPLFGGPLLVLMAVRLLYPRSTSFHVVHDVVDADHPGIGDHFGAPLIGSAPGLTGHGIIAASTWDWMQHSVASLNW